MSEGSSSLSRLWAWRSQHASRLRLRGCSAVGIDPDISGTAHIVNEGRITIGDRFRLSCEPVASHLFADAGGVIAIGDDVSIGHGAGIAARGRIRIGSGSRVGAFFLAMDTDYHVAGDASAVAEIVPIEVGERVRIGNHVTILKGSVIERGARVRDGSVVRGRVAAGEVVEGVPARTARASSGDARQDSLELRVLRVAQATFRLAQLPGLHEGPNQIAAWDSLGALSFALALEEAFDTVLSEEKISGIGCLADAAECVASASRGAEVESSTERSGA